MAMMAHMLPAFQNAPEMQPYKMTVLSARFGQSPFCSSATIPVMMGAASRTPAPSAEQTSVTGRFAPQAMLGEHVTLTQRWGMLIGLTKRQAWHKGQALRCRVCKLHRRQHKPCNSLSREATLCIWHAAGDVATSRNSLLPHLQRIQLPLLHQCRQENQT